MKVVFFNWYVNTAQHFWLGQKELSCPILSEQLNQL